MEPTLETIFWVVLLLTFSILAVGLVVYLLLSRWQKQTHEGLKHIRSRLRAIQAESAKVHHAAEGFTPDDPEPFGSISGEMRKLLHIVDEQVTALYTDYSSIQDGVRVLAWNRIVEGKEITNGLRLPYDWYELQRFAASRLEELEVVEQNLAAAQERFHRLETQGWEVALLSRQVLEHNQNALRLLTALRSANLRDPALDAAHQDAQELDKNLTREVPVYFMSGDEASVNTKADKNSITTVYRVVDRARPAVEELLQNAQAWDQRYKALETALSEMTENFRALAEGVTSMEGRTTYPMNWDVTRPQLATARQKIETLGPFKQPRSLERLERDLEAATALLAQVDETAEHCRKVAEGYSDLIPLIEKPEVKQGADWLRTAQKISEQAQVYDPENWSRALAVQQLRQDIQSMSEKHAILDVKDDSAPIVESQLEVRLEEARQLAKLHDDVRPRIDSIQERLKEMQETERNIRDQVSRMRALMNQAVSLIGANTYLTDIAEKEASQLRAELEEVTDQLEQTQQGTLDKKAQRATALVRKIDQAGNRWLEKLEDGLDELKKTLAERVGVLNSIAFLDEPAIQEAERLLGSALVKVEADPKKPALLGSLPFGNGKSGPRRKQQEQLGFSEVVKELKAKNEEWQRCIVVTHSVEDMEEPVIEQYNRANNQAESTRETLILAMEVIPDDRSWPPTTQFIANERRAFENLEKKWESLKRERLRALQLGSRLGELSESYQDLKAKVEQVAERAVQEQNRVTDLERRLEESKRAWQYQMQSYSQNLYARDEIQELLESADQEVEAVRQRYLRGSIPYNQVVQNLRALCQRVESAQATVDEGQVIDINGVVQRRY